MVGPASSVRMLKMVKMKIRMSMMSVRAYDHAEGVAYKSHRLTTILTVCMIQKMVPKMSRN